MANGKRTAPLAEADQAALVHFIRERGEGAAVEELGVSSETAARAAAGFALNRSTAELIRLKLAAGSRK
jgi:hypothetical protein